MAQRLNSNGSPFKFLGKSKSTGFQGKLGYVFFTICVGLVCFYIGRVEFLADKLQAADRYTKMRGSSDQPGPNAQRPLQPPGKQGPGTALLTGT